MRRDQYLSFDEIFRLRSDASKRVHDSSADRLTWLCVDMALQTGLRVSEMAKITVDDIDFEREFIRVHRHKRRVPTRDIIGMSKSLAAHLKAHIQWVSARESPWKATIWPGERGPWTKRGLQQAWDKACRRVGLRQSIHCARHTVATHMLRNTGNLRMVQKHLGHTSPTTTANFYADVPLEDMIATLDDLFG
jgi:integrase